MKNSTFYLLLFFSFNFLIFSACNTESAPSNDNTSKTEKNEKKLEEERVDVVDTIAEVNEEEKIISIEEEHSTLAESTEEDTVAVRSFTTAQDILPAAAPKSIEDYQPNAKGVYEISWLTLTDIKFEEKIAPEDSALYLYPTFGKIVRSLEGKKVSIKGFVIPIDPTEHYYVLSANPYSSCFFCGKAGPESIMELMLKSEPSEAYELDMFTTFEGIFKLNGTDVEHCNYILEEAVLVAE